MTVRLAGIFAVLCAAVLWGTTGTLQTLLPADREPLVVAAIRLAVGALSLLAMALLAGDSRRAFAHLPLRPVIAAGMAIGLYNMLFFVAVTQAGVGVGTAIAIGSAPVWVTLYEALRLGRLPGPLRAFGQAISILGAALLVLDSGGGASVGGMVLAAAAGAAYAAYSVATGGLGGRVPPATLAAGTFTVAALIAAPAFIALPVAWAADPTAWPALAFLGVVTTGVAYALFTRGLARVATSTAVTLSLMEPLTAWLLAIFVVGEAVTAQRLIGAGLVFAGLALVTLAPVGRKTPQG
ncbi:DME family drug/metabolite transporter [Cereibacter ovatus]|uniref:DME family drug/metabolite transporter n=1 Tax=Cereibacter ovatus TaxID=439529 RepID=A0A285CRV3_9RHOB|nr:EamA family transporter [Cereibacter ovatus]SNX70262.1 DME family drug/metabolite transporter [Cereibacter ovatus]